MAAKTGKTKAGKVLTRYLEIISEEKTEMIKGADGVDRLATKAEALARIIWKRALGYKELDVKTNTDIIHQPEQSKIGIIFDRMEGKAPMAGEDTKGKITAAEKVTEVGKKRIADAGGTKD